MLCSLFEILGTVLTLFIITMLYRATNDQSLKNFEDILEKESTAARLQSTQDALGSSAGTANTTLRKSEAKSAKSKDAGETLPLFGSRDSEHNAGIDRLILDKRATGRDRVSKGSRKQTVQIFMTLVRSASVMLAATSKRPV